MTQELLDPFSVDPLIQDGKAIVDIVVYSVHVGCPRGNTARNEIAMSEEYYKGQAIHLEAAYFTLGDRVPPSQNCTTCGQAGALVYLGSDKI